MVRSSVTRNAQQGEPAVQAVKYSYDPFGRRIAKRDAFGTTRFVWDGNRLLCEARGSHSRNYVYEPGSFVPLAQIDRMDVKSADNVPRAQIHYLHTDHLGTPREVTAPDGHVTWAATYKAWGNALRIVQSVPSAQLTGNTLHDTALDAPPLAQPIRFQGQYFDAETALHYNRFRYYDPDIGRFISQDPIGLLGGSNSSAYAPNPTGWVDPLGLTNNCGACPGNNAPPLPDKIVGNQSDPRAGLNKSGNKHTSGPLAQENGGNGDFLHDLDVLAGPVRPQRAGDRAPPGSLVGDNGVFGRPANKTGGSSIDIPANGAKPHETLHY
jgi:RHS repeat-associated protein